MGIHDCKECWMVTEINGEYECDCILYGTCPLDEKPENEENNM